jgi:hypothetical protein
MDMGDRFISRAEPDVAWNGGHEERERVVKNNITV